MAKLNTIAFSKDIIAAPGNRQPNYIVVSITDANGQAVTGLEVSNFQVDTVAIFDSRLTPRVTELGVSNSKATPMIVGSDGALVDITGVSAGRVPGFYHINVAPIGAETWKTGFYIFAIAVERGADKGQTLATVLLD